MRRAGVVGAGLAHSRCPKACAVVNRTVRRGRARRAPHAHAHVARRPPTGAFGTSRAYPTARPQTGARLAGAGAAAVAARPAPLRPPRPPEERAMRSAFVRPAPLRAHLGGSGPRSMRCVAPSFLNEVCMPPLRVQAEVCETPADSRGTRPDVARRTFPSAPRERPEVVAWHGRWGEIQNMEMPMFFAAGSEAATQTAELVAAGVEPAQAAAQQIVEVVAEQAADAFSGPRFVQSGGPAGFVPHRCRPQGGATVRPQTAASSGDRASVRP